MQAVYAAPGWLVPVLLPHGSILEDPCGMNAGSAFRNTLW